MKADITILGNKTLLRYFRKIISTTINENADLLKYHTPETNFPCLNFNCFKISHSSHVKGHAGSKKFFEISLKLFFQVRQYGEKYFAMIV